MCRDKRMACGCREASGQEYRHLWVFPIHSCRTGFLLFGHYARTQPWKVWSTTWKSITRVLMQIRKPICGWTATDTAKTAHPTEWRMCWPTWKRQRVWSASCLKRSGTWQIEHKYKHGLPYLHWCGRLWNFHPISVYALFSGGRQSCRQSGRHHGTVFSDCPASERTATAFPYG